MYLLAGVVSFGVVPIFSSYIDLTYDIELKEKETKEVDKYGSRQQSNKDVRSNNDVFIDKIDEEDEELVHKKSDR